MFQTLVNHIFCASHIHIDQFLIELGVGRHHAGTVNDNGFASFRNRKKRFQRFHITEITFHNLHFFRHIFYRFISREYQRSHMFAAIQKFIADMTPKKPCRSGYQINCFAHNYSSLSCLAVVFSVDERNIIQYCFSAVSVLLLSC